MMHNVLEPLLDYNKSFNEFKELFIYNLKGCWNELKTKGMLLAMPYRKPIGLEFL